VMQGAGALAFAAAPAARRFSPPGRDRRAIAGALAAPGMRLFVLALAISGVSIGALEIGVPAFAEREGSRDDAGWLFAVWAAGSLAGGLWYGARDWRLSSRRRYLVLSGVLALGMLPLPLAGSLPVFGVLMAVAGLGLAPVTAAAYSVIENLAAEGSVTESFAWQVVGYVLGGAVGAWLAGILVDALSVEAALALAPATAACSLVVALAGLER
jgi:predicted MFS family arabinose efflux permease